MRIVLTSNFPRPGNERVADYLRATCGMSSIAWCAAQPDAVRFADAQAEFSAYGFDDLRWLSADRASAIYLSGGDPLVFRAALLRSPLPAQCAATLVGASGGAMQLTPNLSLFRLLQHDVSQVLEQRRDHAALGLVPFEILPHHDRQSPELLAAVRQYSAAIDNDIWCLADGAAVVQEADGSIGCIGQARCLRGGVFV